MITFLCCIVLLIVSYFTYGLFVERTFGIRPNRTTPAFTLADGVDYVPMGKKRNSLIQLLNIAGVGPIFGPILGALYGPVAFVWIVAGAIFAGAVHDYLTGMISLRNRGAHLPELAGKFLGTGYKHVVNAFSVLLLLLVGTVFVTAPADLLANLTSGWMSAAGWMVLIFSYYVVATIFPINVVIGRCYPVFGALLLASAIGIGVVLIADGHSIPELSFQNMHPKGLPIFPLLFLTISCGALSGFHATQSPIISRTTMNESQGRLIFYGMMIAEAIIAMIWAASAMALFHDRTLSQVLAESGPAGVVKEISISTLGAVGGTIAVLGVIVLPITSGDTAFRSARMIIADYIKIKQRRLGSRLMICVPLFIVSVLLTQMDFSLLWRYFSWANQSLAMIALWIGAVYLALQRKNYFIAAVPAAFITSAVFTYIFYSEIGFGLPLAVAVELSVLATMVAVTLFYMKINSRLRQSAITGEPIDLDDGLGNGDADEALKAAESPIIKESSTGAEVG